MLETITENINKDSLSRINPVNLVRYLSAAGWNEIPVKKPDIKIFQKYKDGEMYQVTVPMERDFIDYEYVLYASVREIADLEERSFEQIVLILVNADNNT